MSNRFASMYLAPHRALIALACGLVLAAVALLLVPLHLWGASILLAFALTWASMVDIDRFILPDLITLGLVLVGLVVHTASGDAQAMLNAALGAIIGYLLLALTAAAYRQLRGRDGLGLGDAKLLAAAGAWLGWAALPLVLLGASVAGLFWVLTALVLRGQAAATTPIPFGPFISGAFFVTWLFAG